MYILIKYTQGDLNEIYLSSLRGIKFFLNKNEF